MPADALFSALDNPAIPLPLRLRAFRLLADLDQQHVAMLTRTSAKMISDMEYGRGYPPPGYLTWIQAAARAVVAGRPIPPPPPLMWGTGRHARHVRPPIPPGAIIPLPGEGPVSPVSPVGPVDSDGHEGPVGLSPTGISPGAGPARAGPGAGARSGNGGGSEGRNAGETVADAGRWAGVEAFEAVLRSTDPVDDAVQMLRHRVANRRNLTKLWFRIPPAWLPHLAVRVPVVPPFTIGDTAARVTAVPTSRVVAIYLCWFLSLLEDEARALLADPAFTPAMRALLARLAPHAGLSQHLFIGQTAVATILPEILATTALAIGIPPDDPDLSALCRYVSSLSTLRAAALVDILHRDWVARSHHQTMHTLRLTATRISQLAHMDLAASDAPDPDSDPDSNPNPDPDSDSAHDSDPQPQAQAGPPDRASQADA